MLKRISVSGEVSNLKYHSSGHIYFTLKDDQGVLGAVMVKNRSQNNTHRVIRRTYFHQE